MKYDYYTPDAMLNDITARLTMLESAHAQAILNAETGFDTGGNPLSTVAPSFVAGQEKTVEQQWQERAAQLEEAINTLREKRDEVQAAVRTKSDQPKAVAPKA